MSRCEGTHMLRFVRKQIVVNSGVSELKSYLDLQCTQNNGMYSKMQGLKERPVAAWDWSQLTSTQHSEGWGDGCVSKEEECISEKTFAKCRPIPCVPCATV